MDTVNKIFAEYEKGTAFKAALGKKGIYEQARTNERFFIGDQWYGAKCGNERPLVRHNIIRRIGDYKISSLLMPQIGIEYHAAGVPLTKHSKEKLQAVRQDFAMGNVTDPTTLDKEGETALITNALSLHAKAVAGRVGLTSLLEQALRNAYISGTGIIYSYWDCDADTGLHTAKGSLPVKGELACCCLKVENVCFGDPFNHSIEAQPYIIISSKLSTQSALFRAKRFGAGDFTLGRIRECERDGKITVLTRLYKKRMPDGIHIMARQVCRGGVLRDEWDTLLHKYPLAKFCWDRRGDLAYGESEVTYLIPNQIAINRMITANVWAGMAMGMPIMVVNGDSVPEQITNDPGQIIKIYGSNEDVAGAVRYVSPPDFAEKFQGSVDSLIKNTMNQSGATEAALGEMDANNATAIQRLNTAASQPMEVMRKRYHAFLEELSLIWADFWMTHYGNRNISIEDENGLWYLPFSAARYKDMTLYARVTKSTDTDKDKLLDILGRLYEKGDITPRQYIESLPQEVMGSKRELLYGLKEDKNDGN